MIDTLYNSVRSTHDRNPRNYYMHRIDAGRFHTINWPLSARVVLEVKVSLSLGNSHRGREAFAGDMQPQAV